MPLAALILGDVGDDAEELPMLLPVMGQTQLEYLARVLNRLGAGHIVLFVSRLPAPLVAAIDRLKTANISVEVVRTAQEAADSIHPDEKLILLPGDLVAPPSQIESLAAADGPTVFTSSEPGLQAFERIDANDFWTGLAVLNGALLRETSHMLGDWQLGPTLLRLALQKGAARARMGEAENLIRLRTINDARRANQALAEGAPASGHDWADKIILAPMIRRLAAQALSRHVSIKLIGSASLLLVLLAISLSIFGYLAASISVFIVGHLAGSVARMVGQLGVRVSSFGEAMESYRAASLVMILLAWAGQHVLLSHQMIVPLLAAWLSTLILTSEHLRKGLAGTPAALFGPTSYALVVLLFALAMMPLIGMGIAIMCGIVTQVLLQRKVKSA